MLEQSIIDVCNVLEKVERTKSRTQKFHYLHALRGEDREVAKSLLSIAADWYRNYGIAELPSPNGTSANPSYNDYLELIASLENRTCTLSKQEISNFLNGYPSIVQKWLTRALLKDLRCGLGTVTINKAYPNLIRSFSCQLADTCTRVEDVTFPVSCEAKIDGIRCIAIVKPDRVDFVSRTGIPLFNCEKIAEELLTSRNISSKLGVEFETYVLDGELFVNTLQDTSSVVKRSVNPPDPDLLDRLVFYTFDIMSFSDWEQKQCRVPYYKRKVLLDLHHATTDTRVQVIPSIIANTPAELIEYYNSCLEAGHEGIMIKRIEGMYTFSRCPIWLKFKPHETNDYYCVGVYEGSGKHKGRLGGIEIFLGDGVYNKVGSGFSDYERWFYWENPDKILNKIVEVKYKLTTAEEKLREPVFLRIRNEAEFE